MNTITATSADVDHTPCESTDCDQTLCLCTTSPCAGTVEQGCIHHNLLCHDCRHECVDCRLDDQADGPGWAL